MAFVSVKTNNPCEIDFIVYLTPLGREKLLDSTIDVNRELTIRLFGAGDPGINYNVAENVIPTVNPDISGDDDGCFPLLTTNCFKPTFTIPRNINASINGLTFLFCSQQICKVIYGDCDYFIDEYTFSSE